MSTVAKKIRTFIERTIIVLVGILFVLSPATAHARGYSNLSPQELEQLGIYFVYGDYTCGDNSNTGNVVSSSNSGNSNAGSWNSGVTAPYILESMMIEALKDIAAKRGVEASKTVTQEHVIALVAFAIGEGGDINNNDIFNPLNTGINAPDLASTAHNASGLQSFKSFDAGVEALGRVMTGNNQRRLSDILIRPESSAEDFMKALTYYQNYPGNKLWAEASQPPHQDSYYKERLDLVAQTRSNYNFYAALQIGLPEFEQKTKKTAPEKLQFHPAGSAAPPASSQSGAGGDGGSTACTCAAGGAAAGKNNVIVIDPGHSGDNSTQKNGGKAVIDPATQLRDYDYPNVPEIDDVFHVSQKVQAKLTADGYKVLMTKDSARADASFRQRADLANNNHAALALSIHDDTSLEFDKGNNFVYVQKVGLHRDLDDGTQIKFGTKPAAGSQAVADLSAQYGAAFTEARTAAEGHKVSITDASIHRDSNFSPGNIWMVQLFSDVPWIYNEAGGRSAGQGGLSEADQTKYANGLIAAVEKAVPITKSTTSNSDGNSAGCQAASDGSIVKEAARLAWPSGSHGQYKKDATQAYQTTEPSPKGAGFTSDSAGDPSFSDCGVFVATVMRSSGADPDYQRRGTAVQLKYLQSSPKFVEVREPGNKDISSTKYLAPGDIMVTTSGVGHTYIYSGKQASGGKDAYSGSYFNHVPQASPFYQEGAGGQHFAAFRLKTATVNPQ
ncbi:MAG TPA: N-acetylmuramoyl-L-alanine amidase [Patescibacteria group bacterium]|nr:N-acetylmuramoyl-L-alanine amidase [Patescibacteria group bacterium]